MDVNKQNEPVACIGTNGELMWIKRPDVLYSKPTPLYTAPTAAAINEQLLEALKTTLGIVEGVANMRTDNDLWTHVSVIKEAIAAAEKKGGT